MLLFRKVIYKSKLIQTAIKVFSRLDQTEFKKLFQEVQQLPGRRPLGEDVTHSSNAGN